MPQLTKGARRALDWLVDVDVEVAELLTRAAQKVKFDPDYSRELIGKAGDLLKAAARYRQTELEPLLERQAPEYERRLSDLEDRIIALEDQRVLTIERVPHQ